MESCFAPIVTALAGDEDEDEDKDMSKGGSIPSLDLETDQLLEEDIPGILRPSTLTQSDEEVKQLLKDIGSDDEDSLRPVKDGDERPDHTPCFWDPPGNL